jgi:MFS family permease
MTRMQDPTEWLHDRLRRRAMLVALVVIAGLCALAPGPWPSALLLVIAAAPAGMAGKLFELRFKMAGTERRRLLRELPAGKWLAYVLLLVAVFGLNLPRLAWAVLGMWLYDFLTYYRDRPERMRHLYAVTKTLDELRDFRAPWAWALPALAWEVVRRWL